MARPNYQYEKRQRDLAKKKKQEEKRLRRQANNARPSTDEKPGETDSTPATDPQENQVG